MPELKTTIPTGRVEVPLPPKAGGGKIEVDLSAIAGHPAEMQRMIAFALRRVLENATAGKDLSEAEALANVQKRVDAINSGQWAARGTEKDLLTFVHAEMATIARKKVADVRRAVPTLEDAERRCGDAWGAILANAKSKMAAWESRDDLAASIDI